ncbi:MAG TPA: 23S rRNA (uracil(1939)-C(5))-methyltransferase RlmD [Halanaerobiales bacterium]|nr:23S rRNA (uracil(1939)-C(5))-methyltransferase RlmD [Halanaerobiales bacterium]
MGINRGDVIELKLDDLANGGDSIGRYQGLAVFVPGGVPGELVRARILAKKRNYARGELLEIIKRADSRIEPECSVFEDCGGCQLQHIEYETQLEYKQKMVQDLLERVAKLKGIKVKPTLPAEYPFAYRNKAQFPLGKDEEGKIVGGFYRRGSHQLIPGDDCLIQHPLINRVMKKTLEILNDYQLSVYDEKKHKGLLRHLFIRVGVCTNQALLVPVTQKEEFPYLKEIAARLNKAVPEIVGIIQNINPERGNVITGKKYKTITGQDYYIDYIGNIKFLISARSFFQVNTLQAKKLYDFVREFAGLSGQEILIDAYCGIGSISLYLAGRAGEIIGIEEIPEAVEDAVKNAELNGIENCRFIKGLVEEKLPELIAEGIEPDLLLFDPPRKGLAKGVIKTAKVVKPKKIIYVSCNPATLARDLKLFKEDYDIIEVQVVDMFPHTYHVETVCLLERK